MKILSILLAETPPTSPMFIRPYKVRWEDNYVDSLMESTNEGTNLSPGAISNVANSMLAPSANSFGQANIANGFGTTRLTLTMVIETENIGGRTIQEVLTGYSDYVGFTDQSGRVHYDPEMRFFFNKVSNLTYTQGSAAAGYGSYQFSNSTQILTPMQGWDANDHVPMINRGMTSLRPKDVLANLGNDAMMGMPMGGSNGLPVVANTTYSFTHRPKRSSLNNNVASEYLSRVLTGYRDTMLAADTDDRSMVNGFQAASEAQFINEPLSSGSEILTALGRRTSYAHEWSVTWRELLSLDPTIAQRVQPIKMTPAYRDTAAAILAGSLGWDGGMNEHQIAQQATLILPSSMARFALGHIHFIAHSETMDGSVVVTLINMAGAAKGIDPTGMTGMIQHHLAHEVYPQLTRAGRLSVYIEAKISINGMSTITVGVNGGDKLPFVAPTYCDAVYSPCLAPSMDQLNGLSKDLGSAAAQLTASALSAAPGIIAPSGAPVRSMTYAQNNPLQPIQNQPGVVPGNLLGGVNGLGF